MRTKIRLVPFLALLLTLLFGVSVYAAMAVSLNAPESPDGIANNTADAGVDESLASLLIGVAAPLNHADGYGWQQVNAVQLAISQTNDAGGISVGGITYTLSMTVAKSACNVTQAVSAANELLDAGVLAVVGHGCSNASIAAAPIYEAAEVAMVTPSGSDPTLTQQGYTNTFRTVSHMGGACGAMANHFYTNLGLERTAILLRVGLWSDTLANAYIDTYTGLGATIVSSRTLASTDDITAALTAIQSEGAQVIFVPDIVGDISGSVSRVAMNLGMTHTIGVLGPIDGHYLSTHAGPLAAEDDFGASMERRPVDMPGYIPFEAAYLAAGFPNEPTPGIYSPTSYDAAQIIIDAIQRAGTTTDTLAIRDAIAATTNFAGVAGTYQQFTANGDIVPQWARISVVERGEWVLAWIQVEVYQEYGGTLNLENTLGTTTTLDIPASAGAQTLKVSHAPEESSAQSLMTNYTILFTTTNAGDPSLTMVEEHGLRLGSSEPLATEMTLTVAYADEDVMGVDEGSLTLHTWNGSQWVDADPCGGYARDTDKNELQAVMCTLGDYVLLGIRRFVVYLPLVLLNTP